MTAIILVAALVSAMVCYPDPTADAWDDPLIDDPPIAVIMSCQGRQFFGSGVTTPYLGGCSTTVLRPQAGTICLRIDDEPPEGDAFAFCVKVGESIAGALSPDQPCGEDVRITP